MVIFIIVTVINIVKIIVVVIVIIPGQRIVPMILSNCARISQHI
jgi:hypothetical protein